MNSLSVVIPVYNAVDHLKNTLVSLFANTDNLTDLVLVDDYSNEETKQFLGSIRMAEQVTLTITHNPAHLWTNYSWDVGVTMTDGDYIAVLNSDIVVSPHWDTYLMDALKTVTIACPMEKINGNLTRLDPNIEKIDPEMIKGACFMFKRQDLRNLFPIPEYLLHYCGDLVLANRARAIKGVSFSIDAYIEHAVSQSGRLIDPKIYNQVTHEDVKLYQEHFGVDMSPILAVMPRLASS
jgi:GT2 family glycosyltransferase